MSENIKKIAWLPNAIWAPLASLKNNCHQARLKRARKRVLKHQLELCTAKKIIVGSGSTLFEGWVSTDQDILNLLIESDWLAFFNPNSLDAILAEHVWEHLTPDQAILAATHCFKFLKPGGHLRVAVPDGFHPDPSYIKWIKPGGTGPGSDDHKVLYTYDTFGKVFTSVGLDVFYCEYFDELGEFHSTEWDPTDGMIQRSQQFDSRNVGGRLRYTSIILDAKKPLD